MVRYSIVIPHYNSLAELRRLIATIPEDRDIQIIVVDDNSTAEVEALDAYLRQGRCEFYRNDTGVKNAGVCRNIGLRHAKGKWVLFADADDYFLDSFARLTDRFYESNYDVIYFAPASIDVFTNQESDRHLPFQWVILNYQKEKSHRSEVMLRYRYCSPCSKIISREYLLKHPISFESVEISNDVMFSTKLAYYMKSFTTVAEPLYCITKSSGTLTTAVSKERFVIRRAVFVRRCLFLRKHLSKSDWKDTRLSGKGQLLDALTKGGGIKAFLETLRIFRKNKIRLFVWEKGMLSSSFKKVFLELKRRKYVPK